MKTKVVHNYFPAKITKFKFTNYSNVTIEKKRILTKMAYKHALIAIENG